MSTQPLHIAIIGGGAAGFFAAITAKQHNPETDVTIFEKQKKVLAKVEITGGGRCNLTNSFRNITDLKQAYPRGHKLLKRLFRTFSHEDTCRWFQQRGVDLVTQDDECVFPAAQDSHVIIDSLVGTARRLGIKIVTGYALTGISRQEDNSLLLAFSNNKQLVFDRVAITTGGHPRKESFRYLADMEHEIEHPIPSLFTLSIADPALRELMGTVVEPVSITIPGTKFKDSGPLLITHWGMSGPAILKLSSHAARHLSECNYKEKIAVNWLCTMSRQELEEGIRSIMAANPQKQLGNIHPFSLPSRLWFYLITKMGLQPNKRWSELGKRGFNLMVETLTNDQYQVSGKGQFKEEFVTCGGVSLSSINKETLESRHVPHLFFAGEVLDIDAITGGFNLQAAWTTGYVVGLHICNQCS